MCTIIRCEEGAEARRSEPGVPGSSADARHDVSMDGVTDANGTAKVLTIPVHLPLIFN